MKIEIYCNTVAELDIAHRAQREILALQRAEEAAIMEGALEALADPAPVAAQSTYAVAERAAEPDVLQGFPPYAEPGTPEPTPTEPEPAAEPEPAPMLGESPEEAAVPLVELVKQTAAATSLPRVKQLLNDYGVNRQSELVEKFPERIAEFRLALRALMSTGAA